MQIKLNNCCKKSLLIPGSVHILYLYSKFRLMGMKVLNIKKTLIYFVVVQYKPIPVQFDFGQKLRLNPIHETFVLLALIF